MADVVPQDVVLPITTLTYENGTPVRSLSARTKMRIKFVNTTGVCVRVFW